MPQEGAPLNINEARPNGGRQHLATQPAPLPVISSFGYRPLLNNAVAEGQALGPGGCVPGGGGAHCLSHLVGQVVVCVQHRDA